MLYSTLQSKATNALNNPVAGVSMITPDTSQYYVGEFSHSTDIDIKARDRLFIIILAVSVCGINTLTPYKVILDLPTKYKLELPDEIITSSTRNVETFTIQQPIDHFNPQNNETYSMRYMTNGEFFGGRGSPIYIMIGGEWPISAGWLQVGNMYESAVENNGFMIYTEHRYYGSSYPLTPLTAENMAFLSVDQALADLAYVIKYFKNQDVFSESKVVLFGGSYAANMAIWFKKKYPHLVEGVLASSGPTLGKRDFHEYLEVVHEALLSEGGEQCIDLIKEAVDLTAELLLTEDGRAEIQQYFKLCSPLNTSDVYTVGYFAGFITWTFSGAVQSASPGTLANLCNDLVNGVYGTSAIESLTGYVTYGFDEDSCYSIVYEDYLAYYASGELSDSIAWYYQTCTEFSFYQIAPSSGTAFDSLNEYLNLEFYDRVCREAFDQRFDVSYLDGRVERINLLYGGLNPVVNKTINIHGAIDPWHSIGILDHLADDSPTVVVPRASHCFDLRPWTSSDTPQMTSAKQSVRRLVAEWLN